MRALGSHHSKDDRASYYDFECNDEYGRDAVLHVLHNRDVKEAIWDSFNEQSGDQDKLIRMILPLPIFASFHVVHGPADRPLSHAKFIKYFDRYRPIKDPEVWWFVSA